jgi:hypothetical protein
MRKIIIEMIKIFIEIQGIFMLATQIISISIIIMINIKPIHQNYNHTQKIVEIRRIISNIIIIIPIKIIEYHLQN